MASSTGAILSALVVDLVVLTAAGGRPEPPLRLAIGWPVVLLGLAALSAAGGAPRRMLTRRAFSTRRRPAATPGRRVIELRDVFRIYQTDEGDSAALQGLSLVVADGEVLVVLGPSGSGSPRSCGLLAGLDRPSAGTVRVFGEDVGRLSSRARSGVPLDDARLCRPALRARASCPS